MITRSDMTGYLTHLTKAQVGLSPLESLIKIITEKRLLGSGSKGYISGSDKVVCFQDMPIYNVAQNAFYEFWGEVNEGEWRTKQGIEKYSPYGVTFPKKYVWSRGGRPVIYDKSDDAKIYMPKSEYWRIVDLNLDKENDHIVDWMYEREWRVKSTEFEFELSSIYVLLWNNSDYKKFVSEVGYEILKEIAGIIILCPILF